MDVDAGKKVVVPTRWLSRLMDMHKMVVATKYGIAAQKERCLGKTSEGWKRRKRIPEFGSCSSQSSMDGRDGWDDKHVRWHGATACQKTTPPCPPEHMGAMAMRSFSCAVPEKDLLLAACLLACALPL